MGKRRKARELTVQVLFHLEFSGDDPDKAFELICESFGYPDKFRTFAEELILGVCGSRELLDELINKASKNWRIKRMSRVDICILRLAVYELIYMEDIPPRVSMDEAVELGKKFGNKDSPRFINGLLDNIYSELLKKELIGSEK